MQREDAGLVNDHAGQHDAPSCDFCGASAVTVENGRPLCGVHAGIDRMHP